MAEKMTTKDNLFSRPLGNIPDFVFGKDVVDVFPDMIKRSVPGYETIIAMTGTLAEKYVIPGSRCYDLGSSLGASTLAVAKNTADREKLIIAVDNSPSMIERCRQVLEKTRLAKDIELVCDNV